MEITFISLGSFSASWIISAPSQPQTWNCLYVLPGKATQESMSWPIPISHPSHIALCSHPDPNFEDRSLHPTCHFSVHLGGPRAFVCPDGAQSGNRHGPQPGASRGESADGDALSLHRLSLPSPFAIVPAGLHSPRPQWLRTLTSWAGQRPEPAAHSPQHRPCPWYWCAAPPGSPALLLPLVFPSCPQGKDRRSPIPRLPFSWAFIPL